jgi:hypothetical protein
MLPLLPVTMGELSVLLLALSAAAAAAACAARLLLEPLATRLAKLLCEGLRAIAQCHGRIDVSASRPSTSSC